MGLTIYAKEGSMQEVIPRLSASTPVFGTEYTCPSPQHIQRIASGRTSQIDRGYLDQHVPYCDRCGNLYHEYLFQFERSVNG